MLERPKPAKVLLGDRVLITVGVLGGAGDGVNPRPLPVVDGARELRVLPVAPGVGAVVGDRRAQHADGVGPHHRAVRVDAGRMRLKLGRRCARRHRALAAMRLLVLAAGVVFLGVRDGRKLQPGKRQHEGEGCCDLRGELHGRSPVRGGWSGSSVIIVRKKDPPPLSGIIPVRRDGGRHAPRR